MSLPVSGYDQSKAGLGKKPRALAIILEQTRPPSSNIFLRTQIQKTLRFFGPISRIRSPHHIQPKAYKKRVHCTYFTSQVQKGKIGRVLRQRNPIKPFHEETNPRSREIIRSLLGKTCASIMWIWIISTYHPGHLFFPNGPLHTCYLISKRPKLISAYINGLSLISLLKVNIYDKTSGYEEPT